MPNKIYIAIDLKSFYASAECAALSLDPLDTNLVVADESRTTKTICLAVSPPLKECGIPGRARLFEVIAKVKQLNAERLRRAPKHRFEGKSFIASELAKNPALEADFLIAPPRMAKYIEISTRIYGIYLKYVSPEDIHVYSIDEVFIDASGYLRAYRQTPYEFTCQILRDVYAQTKITATAGIGTNLYLSKIAMDIVAKHSPPDANGVRAAFLDEALYRQTLWTHLPLTDFWRIGHGIAKRLASCGIYTMGDIAACSLRKSPAYYSEDLLYRLFGVNAELIIDHAWGYEPCEISDIKAYRPKAHSLSSGQVLHRAYTAKEACLVLKEMAMQLSEDLTAKKLLASQIVLTVSYDTENLTEKTRAQKYNGEIVSDHYGRPVPKRARGSVNLPLPTSLPSVITKETESLYRRITNMDLLVRKLNITASKVVSESARSEEQRFEQLSLFTDMVFPLTPKSEAGRHAQREKEAVRAAIEIKKKFGKAAILKGINLSKGATAKERSLQIGGHRA